MNVLITFLTLMLLLLVGMTQNGSIPRTPGYIASGIVAAFTIPKRRSRNS